MTSNEASGSRPPSGPGPAVVPESAAARPFCDVKRSTHGQFSCQLEGRNLLQVRSLSAEEAALTDAADAVVARPPAACAPHQL